jgi:hypothetical protein
MKKLLILCAALLALSPLYAKTKSERIAFSNLGISLNGSTTGVGFTLSTPLAKHFALRAGYQFSYLGYKYIYSDFDPITVHNQSVDVPDVKLDAKLNIGAGHLMVDWIPFKQGKGKFFVTAGMFVGSNQLITIDGQFNMNDPDIKLIKDAGLLHEIEIELDGDVMRVDDSGKLGAQLEVNGFRPYVGLGWGRAIPKHRFGFRFEMGAMFLGHPKIVSDNLKAGSSDTLYGETQNVFSKIIAYPNISLQLTYKILKDK